MAESSAASAPRGTQQYRFRFANAEFDEANGVLSIDGVPSPLEPRPVALLTELLRRANEVVTKEELFDAVWGGRVTVDNVLANAVNKLRKALGEEAGARVTNLPRVGYRLMGPIERTAVGQLPGEQLLDLKAGQAVPHREGYRLDRPLGSGGRNHVWLARHAKLPEQRVFKFASDSDGLRALKREFTLFRVLAVELGERPGFLRVLDANFAEAPFFLECEYGGLDLQAWAAENDRLKNMSMGQRLALFIQIGDAVSAAHSVGVLHKDIKPANVLMSGGAEGPWVPVLTDFGSGHVLDTGRLRDLGLTALGMTVSHLDGNVGHGGTPMYLAPEVIAGQASTVQSDLYSLGLMLYQICVGNLRRPLVTGWEEGIDSELLREDIAASTQGEPTRRLATVAQLVERLLTLELRNDHRLNALAEATARSLATAEHQSQRARRPWLIGLVSSLIVGLTASLWLYARASAAFDQAAQEAERANAINTFLKEDLLLSAEVLRNSTQTPVTMLELVRRGSQRAATRFAGRPTLEASVRHSLARAFRRMASSTDANVEYKSAIALLEKADQTRDPALLSMRFELASVLFEQAQLESGIAMLQIAEQEVSPEQLITPSELAFYAWRARAERSYGSKNFPQAVLAAHQAVAMANGIAPDGLQFRLEAVGLLVHMLVQSGDGAGAEVALKELAALAPSGDSLAAATLARARQSVAGRRRMEGRYPESIALLLKSREALTQAADLSRLHFANVDSDLGQTYGLMGDFDSSCKYLLEASNGFAAALGREHQYFRVTEVNLAEAELDGGRVEAAYRRLVENRPWFVKRTSTGRYRALELALARTLIRMGQAERAIEVLDFYPEPPGTVEADRAWLWHVEAWRAVAQLHLGHKQAGEPRLIGALANLRALKKPDLDFARLEGELRRAGEGTKGTRRVASPG